MKRLFLQLAIMSMMLLVITVVWGQFFAPEESVQWAGRFEALVAITALVAIGVHATVYTYFIVANKAISSAVEEHGYPDPTAPAQAKRNKLKAFRYGFIAICVTAVAMIVYIVAADPTTTAKTAAATQQAVTKAAGPGMWSAITAYLALATNLWAFRNEWKYVKANSVLSDGILATLGEARERIAEQIGTQDPTKSG